MPTGNIYSGIGSGNSWSIGPANNFHHHQNSLYTNTGFDVSSSHDNNFASFGGGVSFDGGGGGW
jgi:hypothetical protein